MSRTQSTHSWNLPPFDTGEYEGSALSLDDGDARLVIRLAGGVVHSINFSKVRWHRFTSLHASDASWIRDAYFRLIRLDDSPELSRVLDAEKKINRPYETLSHFRIFLDETGTHEFLAETAELGWDA